MMPYCFSGSRTRKYLFFENFNIKEGRFSPRCVIFLKKVEFFVRAIIGGFNRGLSPCTYSSCLVACSLIWPRRESDGWHTPCTGVPSLKPAVAITAVFWIGKVCKEVIFSAYRIKTTGRRCCAAAVKCVEPGAWGRALFVGKVVGLVKRERKRSPSS